MPASRALSVWLPVALWAAVIFALSSIPSLGTGLGSWDTFLRKAAHFTEYAILGGLLLRALGREWIAVAAGVAYTASDEFHQHFVPGRHGSPLDVAIDALGVALGVYVYRRFQRTRPGDRPSDMSSGDISLHTKVPGESGTAQRDGSGGQSPGQVR
jgi:VanZ like family